jgi:hypothetical protein
MNAMNTGNDDRQFDYKVEFRQGRTAPTRSSQSKASSTFGRRRGKGPQLYNGIHRRRRKAITW